MADLNFEVNLRISPRVFRWGLAALLLSVMVTQLSSESMTLSTYYPAPSGVYTQMVATGNTWLARNILTSPAPGGVAVQIGTGQSQLPMLSNTNSNQAAALPSNFTDLMNFGPYSQTLSWSPFENLIGMYTDPTNVNEQDLVIMGGMAYNDYWKIFGAAGNGKGVYVPGAGSGDDGQMHFQTGDNANEPFIFEQGNPGSAPTERLRIGNIPEGSDPTAVGNALSDTFVAIGENDPTWSGQTTPSAANPTIYPTLTVGNATAKGQLNIGGATATVPYLYLSVGQNASGTGNLMVDNTKGYTIFKPNQSATSAGGCKQEPFSGEETAVTTPCPPGSFATEVAGIYTDEWLIPTPIFQIAVKGTQNTNYVAGPGSMLCCPYVAGQSQF